MVQLAIALATLAALLLTRRYRRGRMPARAVIVSPQKSTSIARDGAVRSVQAAELTVSRADLDRLWNATNLENLARTYWRFLTRVTLGLIRVVYGENERSVRLLGLRPLTLLRFDGPEYEVSAERGSVRWRIRDGLLVARSGRGCGLLAIVVQRLDRQEQPAEVTKLRIEVEVANFYPAIASGFSTIVYEATQSVVHVLVTHAFLRSLAKLDLAQSRVRRLALPGPGPDLVATGEDRSAGGSEAPSAGDAPDGASARPAPTVSRSGRP